MAENSSSPLPKFGSVQELVGYFETHDLGDYLDHMPEVHFDVDIRKRTYLFEIEEDLARKLHAIAREKHVPAEQLVNVWLREKLVEET